MWIFDQTNMYNKLNNFINLNNKKIERSRFYLHLSTKQNVLKTQIKDMTAKNSD